MGAYFITAAGTEIGKTFTTCALIHAARKKGRVIEAYKPVISGFDASNAATSDTGLLLQALGLDPQSEEEIPRLSPLRFKAPLSPHMAAAHEQKSIDFSALVEWTQFRINRAKKMGALALFEGVGGLMVPLDETHTVRDWIETLQIPVILVAGSYVGSLNHTLLTIEVLHARRIPIAALVVNASEHSQASLEETVRTLQHFGHGVPLCIGQPRVSSPAEATNIHALLEHLA